MNKYTVRVEVEIVTSEVCEIEVEAETVEQAKELAAIEYDSDPTEMETILCDTISDQVCWDSIEDWDVTLKD